ncbi:MAG: lactonase family protein [Aggregatilineales bacterium]
MTNKTLLYVGTYTRPAPYLNTTNGKGIYVYEFDRETGHLTHLHTIEGIDNPSYLALDSRNRYLYAISEVWGWKEGVISAYAVNPSNGELTYINKQVTQGGICAYVSVDKTDRYVLMVNFWEGKNAAVFAICEDGGLAPTTCTIEYSSSGVHHDRPHSHCIELDPTNKYACIADLGIDKIMVYQFDAVKGCLVPNAVPGIEMDPASGPRHFIFHPNGKFAYVIQESAGTVTAFAFDASSGTLQKLQTVSTLPAGYSGHIQAADLHLTPSGKFLYGSNRGHDSIVIYAVDENTGMLTYVGNQSTKGKTPRNFAIDPTGAFLLAANQDSDNIVIFKINSQSGQLEETGQITECPTPVCLKMVQV